MNWPVSFGDFSNEFILATNFRHFWCFSWQMFAFCKNANPRHFSCCFFNFDLFRGRIWESYVKVRISVFFKWLYHASYLIVRLYRCWKKERSWCAVHFRGTWKLFKVWISYYEMCCVIGIAIKTLKSFERQVIRVSSVPVVCINLNARLVKFRVPPLMLVYGSKNGWN